MRWYSSAACRAGAAVARNRSRSILPEDGLIGLAPAVHLRAREISTSRNILLAGPSATARPPLILEPKSQVPACDGTTPRRAYGTSKNIAGTNASDPIYEEGQSLHHQLEELLDPKFPTPESGAIVNGGRPLLVDKRLGVRKESELRARTDRVAMILQLARMILVETRQPEGEGTWVDSTVGKNAGIGRLSPRESGGEDTVKDGPSSTDQSGVVVDSSSSPGKRPQQRRPRISPSHIFAISSAVADLAPRLMEVVAINGPNVVELGFLKDLEEISRRLFIISYHLLGGAVRESAAPVISATAGSQVKRLKKWGPRKTTADDSKAIPQRGSSLCDITFKAYGAVLALLTTRQQSIVDPQRAQEALDVVNLSLDKAMAKLHFLYGSSVAKHRQTLVDEIRLPAKELFSLWLTSKYLASKAESFTAPAPADEPPVPRLPSELGFLIGLSHNPTNGHTWKQSQDAIAAAQQDESVAERVPQPINLVEYRKFLRGFEVRGLTYSWRDLSAKLQDLLKANELQGFSALWDDTIYLLRRGRRLEASDQPERMQSASSVERKFANKTTRSAYISACLTAIHKTAGAQAIVDGTMPVRDLVSEMLGTYGSPHSSEICQGILLLREKGLLNQDTMKSLTLSERAIFVGQNVRGYWANLAPEGVQKDIPLYSDYIRILGHYDDFNGLVDVWEELRTDAGCEERYKAACESRNEAFSYPPTSIFNLFMSVLLHNTHRVANSQQLAIDMFDYLQNPGSTTQPNLETMNIMIRHHCKKLDIPSVMRVLARISELGLKADVVTYTTVVQCFLDSGRRADAWRIIDAMDAEGVKRNQYLWSKIIAETARSGEEQDLREAERALVDMQKEGLEPNVVTWTGLIGGYFRGGHDKKAVERLDKMVAKGIRLNTVTCNMILRGCMSMANNNNSTAPRDKPLNPRIAFNILAIMHKNGARPDEDTWYLLLHGFVMHGMMEEASLVVEEMDRAGFVVPREGGLARSLRSVAGWRRARERR